MRRAARIASVPVAHILCVCGFEACHPVDKWKQLQETFYIGVLIPVRR